ncbi:MAG TPA: MFS transporter [Gemmatimonadaceae bacterium]|nr:MFS transporter [Gemmatimonadaceae bacterium]
MPAAGEVPAPRSLNPFGALQRHRNYRRFWIGYTVSLIGTWMRNVAQGWLALELTNDAFMVGLVGAVGNLPVLLFSLFGGVLADRYSKLRIVRLTQTLLLVEATAMWWLTWTGQITVPRLLALATIVGMVSAFDVPARQALQVELVGREDLLDAIALNSSGFNLARIIGPAIAAFIIAHAGLAWCFGVNALSYFAVLIGLLTIRLPAMAARRGAGSPMKDVWRALVYMSRKREVSALMRLVAVFSVFGVPYLVLMPVLARDVLHTDASGYGFLLTCVGVGAIAAALALATFGRQARHGWLLERAAYAFPVLLVALAMSRSVWLSAALLVTIGFTMILNNALANTLLQVIVPNAFRGRVMAAYALVFIGFSPIGQLFGGMVASRFGVQWAIGGGAVIMLVYAAWAFSHFEEVRAL